MISISFLTPYFGPCFSYTMPYNERTITKNELNENTNHCSQFEPLPPIESLNNCNENKLEFEENSMQTSIYDFGLTQSKVFEYNYNTVNNTSMLFQTPKITTTNKDSDIYDTLTERGYYPPQYFHSNATSPQENLEFFDSVHKNKFRSPSLEVAISPEDIVMMSQYQENFSNQSSPIETNHHFGNTPSVNAEPQQNKGSSPFSSKCISSTASNTTYTNRNHQNTYYSIGAGQPHKVATNSNKSFNRTARPTKDKTNFEGSTLNSERSMKKCPKNNNQYANSTINSKALTTSNELFSFSTLPKYTETGHDIGMSSAANGMTRHSSPVHGGEKSRSVTFILSASNDKILNDIFMSSERLVDGGAERSSTTSAQKVEKKEGIFYTQNKVTTTFLLTTTKYILFILL